MRVESPSFTEREMLAFLGEVTEHERERLIARLEAASQKLAQVAAAGIRAEQDSAASWSGHDVLAHIVVLSKFYGMLTYQVGSGKVTEVPLLDHVRNRDVAGEQLAALPDQQLLALAAREHERTLTFLRSADAAALQRRTTLAEGVSMSALELATLGLCSHLEIHLDQLERTRQP